MGLIISWRASRNNAVRHMPSVKKWQAMGRGTHAQLDKIATVADILKDKKPGIKRGWNVVWYMHRLPFNVFFLA